MPRTWNVRYCCTVDVLFVSRLYMYFVDIIFCVCLLLYLLLYSLCIGYLTKIYFMLVYCIIRLKITLKLGNYFFSPPTPILMPGTGIYFGSGMV